jgi:uncharacterized membrane protein YgcG
MGQPPIGRQCSVWIVLPLLCQHSTLSIVLLLPLHFVATTPPKLFQSLRSVGGQHKLCPDHPLPSPYPLWAPPSQELPCDHTIVTSYSADLLARFQLAARATKPQGAPLLTHRTPTGLKTPDRPATTSAAAAVGRVLEQADKLGPDITAGSSSSSSSDGGGGSSSSSGGSSTSSSSGGELVFRSSSWVVGVNRHTGKAIGLW